MRRGIDRRHDLLLGAFADRKRDAGAEIGDDVGCARAQCFLRGRAAAVERELGLHARLLVVAERFGGVELHVSRVVGNGEADANEFLRGYCSAR